MSTFLGKTPQPSPASRRISSRAAVPRRWLMLAGVLIVSVAGGVLLAPMVRRHYQIAHLQAGLPAMPDPATMPPTLVERLEKAQAEAGSPQSALAGTAELGRLYHASGYAHEAETCWQLLHTIEPREAHWVYLLADLRRIASDYSGMDAWLTRTTELAPDYAPAWLHLGDLQFKTGHVDDAERSYLKRLVLLPKDPYARLGLTRIALQQGQRDQARKYLEELIKDSPEFSPGHNLYAEMLDADGDAAQAGHQRWLGRETGRFREADDPWLDELTAWCFNYDQLCVRGTVDFQTNHGDMGKSCFERAIQIRPDLPTAYELLGSLYLQHDDAARARDVFQDGLQHATTEKPAAMYYINLSRAYRMLKQPAEAVRIAREGLAQVGKKFELYDALGVALNELGQGEAAVEALRTAVDLNPRDANANYNLAVALIAVRRLDGAVEALHRSLALKPTFPSTLAMLAQIEFDSGRWKNAAQYLQPLYESHPEMPQARSLMADWHLHAGMEAEKNHDLAAAEKHYRDGVAIERNNPDLQAGLGSLCLIQGRFADALEPLEAYRRLQPDNPRSSLFLGQVYARLGRLDDARRTLTEGAKIADRAGNPTTARYCREILRQLPES